MKRTFGFLMAAALAVGLGSAASAGTIYDNGGPDGHSGLSMLFDGGFDAFREIADDFDLGGGAGHPGWLVDGFSLSYIWGDGAGLGLFGDFQVEIFQDTGAGPGAVISSQIVPFSDEFLTGDTYFGRPEIRVSAKFAPVALAPDTTYWISMTPFAPQNGFVLTSHNQDVDNNVVGEGVYIRFPKFGFPDYAPGSGLFGDDHDISFSLQGEAIPAPGVLALLGVAGLVGVRRRRR